MERRKFLRSSCSLCLLAASGAFLSELAACSPAAYRVMKTEIVNDTVSVPVTSLSGAGLHFVRPQGWYFDIAVTKTNDDSYQALLMQCTHQENQLMPAGNGFTCSLHGSQFDKEGKVIKGPAEQPLKHYNTAVVQDKLIIQLKTT